MRSPIKSLGPILLASTVGLGGAVQMAHTHARAAAAPVTITVAYQQFGAPPYSLVFANSMAARERLW